MAVSKRLRFEVFRRDNFRCRYCGATPAQAELRVDHVVPEALGGKTEPSNLVTACDGCNSGKSSIAPDSPIVDDVRQDALRWSRALAMVAERLLVDLEAKNALRSAFQARWNEWTLADGEAIPLPNSWINSVDNFMAAGLPMEVLIDCLNKAMGVEKLKPENVFRYMCGIAWSRATEMQEAARVELGGDEPAAEVPMIVTLTEEQSGCTGCHGAGDLAVTVLDMLTPLEREDAIRMAEQTAPDARIYESTAAQAAYVAVGQMDHHRSILTHAIDKFLHTVSVPERILEEADAEVAERLGDNYTDYDIAANRLHHVTRAVGAGWVTI